MKAKFANDKCYCTVNKGFNPFNFSGAGEELTYEQAYDAVDFDIEKKRCYDENGREIPSLYHITRTDTNDIIPSDGLKSKYKALNHRDVLQYVHDVVMPIIPEAKLETAGTLYGGGLGLFTLRVGDTFSIRGDNSPNEMRLFISNPVTGRGALTMGFTTVRLFCHNQIAKATKQAGVDGFRIHHSLNCDLLYKEAVHEIAAQVEAAKEIKLRCERLAEIGVDTATVMRCIDAIYPFGKLEKGTAGHTRMLNYREAVLKQFEVGETAQTMTGEKSGWTLFNSFTYPIFNPEKIRDDSDIANIQYNAMAGTKAERVNRILDTVEREVVFAA